jgi:diketogulonate reductase-like aldo/keto reductase
MNHLTIPTVSLNDGTSLPALGFGTYRLYGSGAVASVTDALEQGYRLIDTAVNYRNESEVGRAVAEVGVDADTIVVTTKIPGRDHGYDATMRSFEGSVERLGRVDLYLIHWPNPRHERYVDTWRAMVDLQRQGRVRSIGVSNFTEQHLREITDATGVAPAVNQVEMHPQFPQTELRRFHHELGIVTESWTPFGEARSFTEPAVTEPAGKYGRTPAQIVMRWHVQLGAVPLPKSGDPKRRNENAHVFDFSLTEPEVAAITALGRPAGRLWGGDPKINEEM